MQTDERLQAIRDRAEAATPGPWKTGKQFRQSTGSSGNPVIPIDCQYPGEVKGVGLVAWLFKSALPKKFFRANAKFIANARADIPYLLSLVDEPPAEAPLTDAEVDAYLEAHKNDPVDEDQARRVERLFRDKLATDALNAGREWLQSYQEDVVKGGRRVKHDTELLYSGTKTLIENLVRVIDTLALVDTARPTEQQPCRECGEMDHHRLTCSLNYVSPGVEFRTHVLDSERRRPTAQDAQVAQSIDIGDCPCVSYHYDVVTHGNATIPVKKQCRVHKEIAAALSTARQQGAEAERERNPDDAPCVGQGHNAGFCHQCRRYYD